MICPSWQTAAGHRVFCRSRVFDVRSKSLFPPTSHIAHLYYASNLVNIATIFDREGIKNRILIVSACYAGVFVTRLATPDSVILTASDDKNPSFGCSNERDWTYFGNALFNENLGAGVSLEEAFANAKVKVSKWEQTTSRHQIRKAFSAPPFPNGFTRNYAAANIKLLLTSGETQGPDLLRR